VVAGFEPADILRAVGMLLRQVAEGRAEVEVEYSRAVRREGKEAVVSLEIGPNDVGCLVVERR
jgi:hydrogenase expression/formation protein HypD